MRIEITNAKTLQLVLAIIGMLAFASAPAAPKDFELHQAVLDNDLQLVKKFLSKGANVNLIGPRKYGYGSALHLAVREGHLDIAKLLLGRGAQVDVLDPDDFTPLHNAAWNGNLEMMQLLLDAGADIEASTYDGDTPLTLAQNNNQAKVAEFILEKLAAPSTVTAKVETQATGDAGVIDISGIYTTEITYSKDISSYLYSVSFGNKPDIAISIEQQGNVIIGVISGGRSGEIEGVIKGNEVTYEFYFCGGGAACKEGKGTWLVSDNHTLLSGTWKHSSSTGAIAFFRGNWSLTKIESTPPPLLTGTYAIAELTYPKEVTRYKDWMLGKGKNLELTIQQSGSTVTGVFSGDLRGTIKGVVDRNEITFEFDGVSRRGSSNDGEGVLFFSEDSAELIGTFKLDSGHYGSMDGKWNFRRIEGLATDAESTVAKVGSAAAIETGVIDISGTYTSTLTYPSNLRRNDYRWYLGESGLEITIEQKGNDISGVFTEGGKSKFRGEGTFKGKIRGNEVTVELEVKPDNAGHKYGAATWNLEADGKTLTGKWQLDGSTGVLQGLWNLAKIE